jgi:hypothetical protein
VAESDEAVAQQLRILHRGAADHGSTDAGLQERAAAVAVSGGKLVLMPMVVASFLRLVSSPRIFLEPTPNEDAVALIDALLGTPAFTLRRLGRSGRACDSFASRISSRAMPFRMPGLSLQRITSANTW